MNSDLHGCVYAYIYMNIYTAYYIDKRILGNLENHLKYNKIVWLKNGIKFSHMMFTWNEIDLLY